MPPLSGFANHYPDSNREPSIYGQGVAAIAQAWQQYYNDRVGSVYYDNTPGTITTSSTSESTNAYYINEGDDMPYIAHTTRSIQQQINTVGTYSYIDEMVEDFSDITFPCHGNNINDRLSRFHAEIIYPWEKANDRYIKRRKSSNPNIKKQEPAYKPKHDLPLCY